MSSDELFMHRALDLARNGAGMVSPNPMVGCVIVQGGEVIGEGWHRAYGGPHAEVNAIASVCEKGRLPGSTVYLNLEPCAHYGKTPPCADLLVHAGVGRVFVANTDPNPLVSGKGIDVLRKAGIVVETGLLSGEGEELNCRFFTYYRLKRPYIILKWAETSDGYMAPADRQRQWISGVGSRILVHKWRSEEDAVMVGKNTALYDNPRLNVRDWSGRQPLRALVDRHLALRGKNLHLFDRSQPTVCYNTKMNESGGNPEYVACDSNSFFEHILDDLHRRQVLSLMVEGGAELLKAFIVQGLWDEARVFRSPAPMGSGLAAPLLAGASEGRSSVVMEDELFVFKRMN